MRIEIIDKEGNFITDFELESNPFKVGETIDVNVSNHDKSFWTTGDLKGDYIISRIDHFLRKDFFSNRLSNTVFTVSVEVFPISLK